MKSVELKIKLKHLAEEARIIRAEAQRQYEAGNTQKGNDLTNHRKQVVRPEARATLLAYQFLRCIPYRRCEPKTWPNRQPNWHRVLKMVKKYGHPDFTEADLKEWRDEPAEKAA